MKNKIYSKLIIGLSIILLIGCSESTSPEDEEPSGSNIANEASITYSSISTSSYHGYTPNANHTVDGVIEHNDNFWSAQSFSGSGWIAFKYSTEKALSEIRVYAGSAYYGDLYYSVQYLDAGGSWVDSTTPAWVNADLSGCSEYSTSAQNVYEYVVDASNISTKGIRVNVTDSHYPSSHLWRTVVTEVEIIKK